MPPAGSEWESVILIKFKIRRYMGSRTEEQIQEECTKIFRQAVGFIQRNMNSVTVESEMDPRWFPIIKSDQDQTGG